MLHVADRYIAADGRDAPDTAIADIKRAQTSLVADPPVAVEYVSPSGRYGERRFSPTSLGFTLLAHVAFFALLIAGGQQVMQREEHRLVTVELSAPPPPPPPPPVDADSPAPKPVVISAPAPLIAITPPQPAVVPVTLDPQPAPVAVESSVPAPAATGSAVAPRSAVQGGDLGAKMIAGQPPRYPTESRRKKEQGTVVLSLTLGIDGAVEQISVSGSSGFDRLDKAALDAVRKWRWEPVKRDGQPVKVRGTVEIPFVLKG